MHSDKEAEFGPPDKVANFNITAGKRSNKHDSGATKKMAIEISNDVVAYILDKHPELNARTKFDIEWFGGIINQKYGVYFPCDQETVFVSLDDDDFEIVD